MRTAPTGWDEELIGLLRTCDRRVAREHRREWWAEHRPAMCALAGLGTFGTALAWLPSVF